MSLLPFLLLAGACIPPTPAKVASTDTASTDTDDTDDTGGTDDTDDTADTDDTDDCADGEPASDWYRDADGDGFGDDAVVMNACDAPLDYVESAGDCNDRDATAFPGSHATEIPGDGIDTDCDGVDACGDLNCDAWPELVFSSYRAEEDEGNVLSWVYRGGEDGFSDSVRVPLATPFATGVSAGDVNGDGYLDLAFGRDDGSDGAFGAPIYIGPGYSPDEGAVLGTSAVLGTAAADLDGDGVAEIVLAGLGPDLAHAADSLVFEQVAGVWSEQDALATVGAAACLTADVDADGSTDIVFANRFDGTTYEIDSFVYLGSGFLDPLALPTLGAAGLAIADLDGDGAAEIIFANERDDSGHAVDSWIYFGADDFAEAGRVGLPTLGARDVAAGDLDADGHPDLVFANSTNGTSTDVASYVYWGSAEGFAAATRTELDVGGAAGVDVADLDADGDLDVVFARGWDSAEDTGSLIFWGDGSRAIDTGAPTTLATTGAYAVMACPGGKRCGR